MAEPSYFQYQGPDQPPGYTPPASSGGWSWSSVLSGLSATSAPPPPAQSSLTPVLVVALVGAIAVTLYLVSR